MMKTVRNVSRFFSIVGMIFLFVGCQCPLCSKSEKAETAQEVAPQEVAQVESAAGQVVVVTSADQLENLKTSTKNLIVKFFAPWCPPCRAMEPVDKEMAKKFTDKVTIAKVDIDKVSEAAGMFGVQGVPTYVYLKNGGEVHRVVGASSVGDYERMIKEKFGL